LNALTKEVPDKLKTEHIRKIIYDKLPMLKVHNAMYRIGMIERDDDDDIPIPKCLFDTGASHTNYISKRFVDEHRNQLNKYIFKYESSTTLGDGKSKVAINEVAVL
jgi:hypothetical protein